jgi:hypothetical protein
MKTILSSSKRTKLLSLIILIGFFGYAQEEPFNCDYNAYLFQRNDIYALDLASGSTYLVKEDITPEYVNAVGYNPAEGYIWGSLNSIENKIVRIGKKFKC